MKIIFHKKFDKAYVKLQSKLQCKVDETLLLFQKNPFAPSLNNHSLQDELKGKRAIRVTSDIRIIFEKYEDYAIVIMLDLGKHTKVYKKY